MSGERRLEYDKGPSLEEDERTTADDADDRRADDDGDDRDDPAPARRVVVCPSWAAGLVSGVGAFAAVFAATYQLATAMVAAGAFSWAESEPSHWVVAGLTMLGSHGASIEAGGERIDVFAPIGFFTSHVSALVPIVVLAAVGYLLVRYVRLETLDDGAVAFGVMTVSYVVPAVVLAQVATWDPGVSVPGSGAGAGDEAAVVAASTDLSMAISTGLSVLLFAGFGAAIAAAPRLLEYAPVEIVEAESK